MLEWGIQEFFANEFTPLDGENTDERRIRILRAAIPRINTALSDSYNTKGWKASGIHLNNYSEQSLPEDGPIQQPIRPTVKNLTTTSSLLIYSN